MFCPAIRFTGAAVSQVPATFTLAVVVPEQPTPPCVTLIVPIDPLLFTLAAACAVQLPLNINGTCVPYGSNPNRCSEPTPTPVTAPPVAVTVSCGCTAFHTGNTTAFRTVQPPCVFCCVPARSSTSPVGGSAVAAELPAIATTLSSTLFEPAAAVNPCVAWIVMFCHRFESEFSPAGAVPGTAGLAMPVFSPRISIFRNSLHCGHCAKYNPQVCVECAPAYCAAIGSTPVATISRFSISATRSPFPPAPVAAGIAIAQLPTAHPLPVPIVPFNPLKIGRTSC